MKRIITIAYLLATTNLLFSQVNYNKCNTTKLVKNEAERNPEYLKKLDSHNSVIVAEKATITIPIAIHIIHRNSHSSIGTGTNISDEQIEDAIKILNQDYSKTNPEFPNPPRNTFISYAGNPELEFCLATTDPDGNPTSGITRTATTQLNWDADDDSNTPCHEANAMKKSSCGGKDGWDPSKYLNIWICDLTNSQSNGMTLGYAYLPGLLADFNSSNDYKDGLVVDYRYFGTVGIAAPSSDGRTATHEIGHYLGLMHTFCEETDAQGNWSCCDNDDTNWGGYVDDTPATKDIYFGAVTANTNNNTCNDLSYPNIFTSNVLDMDENFMSYATNTWMFSQGQVDVMLETLNRQDWQGGRLNLKNSNISRNCSGIISSTKDIIPNTDINIYPIPSSGEIFINDLKYITNIYISNIIGDIVISDANIKDNSIDLSELQNGIYFVNIKIDNAVITKKIILAK